MKKKLILICVLIMSVFCLNAQNSFSVSGTVKDSLGIPIPNYSVHISTDTLNGSYNFVYNSTTVTDSNGNYSSPVFSFPSTIIFNFYIFVYDCNGYKHMTTVLNTNIQNNVDFTICTPTAGCFTTFSYTYASNQNSINLHDLSSGNPTSWLWNFGDGTTSTLQNPLHVYNSNGVFPVCLTTTNSNNCTSTYCDSIYIFPSSNQTCISNFTYNPVTISGQTSWHFNNISTTTIPGHSIIYIWNFGDGTTSSLQNPTHIFQSNSIGMYNVCLTTQVLDSLGVLICQNMYCQNIIVNNSNGICQNSFYYTNQNNMYTFYGQINSSNPTTYSWDFGDGTTSNGQIVTHTFAQPLTGTNSYNVCLKTITSGNSGILCVDTSYISVQIQPLVNTCNAMFFYHADTSSGNLNTIHFNNYSTTNFQNYQINYLWDFGDGVTSALQNPVHTFSPSLSGIYNVCLTITLFDSNNTILCQNTYCESIYSGNNQLICHNNFTYSNQGLMYSFAGNINTSDPTLYYWDFGDGTTSTNQTVTHTFAQTNINTAYIVRLITVTTNSNGYFCSDTTTQLIPVNVSNQCNALFYAYADSVGSGNLYTYHFMNYSSFPSLYSYTIEYLWNFGDGTTSTTIHPWHTFTPNSSNSYNVCLTIVLKSSGVVVCQDSYCYNLNFNSSINNCQNSFSYTNQSLNYQFQGFINATGNKSYYWDFGDGQTGFGSNVSHTYAFPMMGNTGYNVRLISVLTNQILGTTCTDTSWQFITISGNSSSCSASYTNYSDTITGINTVYFTNTSTVFNSTFQVFYFWNFGDGTSSTIQNPVHVFQPNPSGKYNVCLNIVLKDLSGNIICQDYFCKNIIVGVAINNCQNSFTYTNQSYNYSFAGNVNNNYFNLYKWDFGDGTTATGKNVNHIFNQPLAGVLGYNVRLVTISSYNGASCTDTSYQFITIGISDSCNANFSYIIDTLTNYNYVVFTNLSSYSYNNVQCFYTWNFGDGSSSHLENPNHYFQPNANGIYNVCLQIKIISNGITVCQNTYCQNIYVGSSTNYCHNSFTYNNQNLQYTFTGNINSSNSTSYFWNFGDGSTASGQFVTHTFTLLPSASNGFNVCLITTTTDNGSICVDTSCQYITINNANGNIIQGYVYAGNNIVVDGNVQLYQANNLTMSYSLVNTIALDTSGFYQFFYQNSTSATPAFLVKAILNSTSTLFNLYAPSFYLNTVNWFTATPVFPSSNNMFYNINLIQLPLNQSNGAGNISGNVILLGTKSNLNIPLNDVEIILTDENDLPLRISYSNLAGNFSFNNLIMGNYKLYVEIAGVISIPYPISLNSNNLNSSNILITINNNIANITGIENDIENKLFVSEVYPTPSINDAFIKIKSNNALKVNVSIYDITGKKIVTSTYDVDSEKIINLNERNLSNGVYTVKIDNIINASIIRKLIISK